ncbi:MAG: hypothetical protein AB9903_35630 [Vulcanimicrobiota bacterium]
MRKVIFYLRACILASLSSVLMIFLLSYSISAKEVTYMVNELETLGIFTVTLQGETLESYPSKKKVFYFEWHYGEKGEMGWVSFSTGYRSEKDLTIVTPKGTFELPVRLLRPYLSPVYLKTYTGKTIKDAPSAARELYSENGKPVTLEEYCLEPGKTYHAKVSEESYFLPPGEDGNPIERHNKVLILSDSPFKDGMPQKEITPGYRGWTY